ncbi:MAG TPA: SPOR domain-containing protein [Caulobacteraceae bacterium]|jgi:hypothetical protein
MSNTLRDPTERPLAFDGYAARPRRGPMPVTLILSLLVLAGVGGGVAYLYRGGVRSPDGPPEPVGAPLRDVRVAAPPQAPTVDPASGLSIYRDDPNAAPAAPAFVAPPEQPAPRPGPPSAPIAAAAPATVAAPVVAASAAKTLPTAPVTASMAATTGLQSSAVPTVVKPAKPAKPAAKSPSIDTLLAEAPVAPPPATPKRASPAPGGYAVQIGAFSSPALADKSWNAVAGLEPGAMAGKGKHVAQITKSDGTTLYRTSITGFGAREDAQALCAKLTAAGRTCFVR